MPSLQMQPEQTPPRKKEKEVDELGLNYAFFRNGTLVKEGSVLALSKVAGSAPEVLIVSFIGSLTPGESITFSRQEK